MNIKLFYCFLSILFSMSVSAQDLRFENKNAASTETISFTLEGNKIVDGEWEHVSNSPNTSGEVYGFTGKKSGNKFIIVFTGTIPYATPSNTKNAEWILTAKELLVPTKQENKKMGVKNVVFKKVNATG